MKGKILITPSSFAKCGNQPLELLRKNNYITILNPYGRKMTPDEVIQLGKECIGIIAGVESLNSKVFKSLSSLRCISRVGVGIDNVDLKCAKELGLIVKNTPEGPTRAVGELTIGLIFDMLRKISFRDRELRKGKWNKEMGYLLQDKKIGIIGLGRIGRTVAELLSTLGARVSGNDINPDTNWAKIKNVPLLPLSVLLKDSDIVCIHISSSGNIPLIRKKEIDMMKKGSFLVNISRGGVIDEDALYVALDNGYLAGAALDVFDQEPYSGPLTKLDNVILTPHIGSYAKESRLEMETQAVKNLLEVLKN